MTPLKIDFDDSPEAIQNGKRVKKMWIIGLILYSLHIVLNKALEHAVDNYENSITGWKFTLFATAYSVSKFAKYAGGALVIAVIYIVITAIIQSSIGNEKQKP